MAEKTFDITLSFSECYETVKTLIYPYKMLKVGKDEQFLYLIYHEGTWHFLVNSFLCDVSRELKSVVSSYTPDEDFIVPVDIKTLEPILSFFQSGDIPAVSVTFSLLYKEFGVSDSTAFADHYILASLDFKVKQMVSEETGSAHTQIFHLPVCKPNVRSILNTFASMAYADQSYETFETSTLLSDFRLLLEPIKHADPNSAGDTLFYLSTDMVFSDATGLGLFYYEPKCKYFSNLCISKEIGSLLYQYAKLSETFDFCKVELPATNIQLNTAIKTYLLICVFDGYRVIFKQCNDTARYNERIAKKYLAENRDYAALPSGQFVCKSTSLLAALKSLNLVKPVGLPSENTALMIDVEFSCDMKTFVVRNTTSTYTLSCSYYAGEPVIEKKEDGTEVVKKLSIVIPIQLFERAMLEKAPEYVFCFESMPNIPNMYRIALTTPEYLNKLRDSTKAVEETEYATDWVTAAVRMQLSRN